MFDNILVSSEMGYLINTLEEAVKSNLINSMIREEEISKTKYNDMMFCVELLKSMKQNAESSSNKSS
jgi:hypothetical protein